MDVLTEFNVVTCRNGLYSPLGIETEHLGHVSTLVDYVGMASTARWGLKHTEMASPRLPQRRSEWPLQPVGD